MLNKMKLPLSLVVIAYNEERHIGRCLNSVPFASEIVVVDSGSQDQTAAVCQKMGAKVIQKLWTGYGPQKKFAVDQASHDWVICLDADEELSPELQAEILKKFSSLEPAKAYKIPRVSYYLGRWIWHGGWYPDYQIRLFNRQHSQWNEAQIHEKVIAKEISSLEEPIRHYVFSALKENVETNIKYSHLQAEDWFKQGKKFSLLKLITKPFSKFIECYFLKLGFLDGLAGFVIAIGAAHSLFMRWIRLWELQKTHEQKKENQ